MRSLAEIALRTVGLRTWVVALLLAGMCRASNTAAQGVITGNYGHQVFNDFDDLHSFSIIFDLIVDGAGEGSGAVDALDVIWLGEAPREGQEAASQYTISQGAEALRMRNWQKFGFAGGTLKPDIVDSDSASPFADAFSRFETVVPNRVGLAYGVGTISTEQQVQTTMTGSILGKTEWSAGVDNQIAGPKAGLIWQHRHGRWSFDMQGFVLLGFNAGEVQKYSVMGDDLLPGALNRPLYARRTESASSDSSFHFSPVGEIRAQTNLQISKSTSLHAGWSSLMINDFLAANGNVSAALPTISFDVSNDRYALNYLFCGVEYVR